jgi:hypothetical protein
MKKYPKLPTNNLQSLTILNNQSAHIFLRRPIQCVTPWLKNKRINKKVLDFLSIVDLSPVSECRCPKQDDVDCHDLASAHVWSRPKKPCAHANESAAPAGSRSHQPGAIHSVSYVACSATLWRAAFLISRHGLNERPHGDPGVCSPDESVLIFFANHRRAFF